MFSRHLTLVTPSFTSSYITNILYLFYFYFFVIFGMNGVCEWLVPITMYGDENKNGQIIIRIKKAVLLDGCIPVR